MTNANKTRRIVVTTTARDEKTHELRTFVFRQPMKGVRGIAKTAICFDSRGNVCSFRMATKGDAAGRTLEITRFRGHRFYAGDSQPAEYSSHSKAGAIAQFKAEFKGWVVL